MTSSAKGRLPICSANGKPGVNLEQNLDMPDFSDPSKTRINIGDFGGREGIRTPGLLVANEALSQLSYSPTVSARNHCSINTLWENLGTIKRPAFQPQPCAVPE